MLLRLMKDEECNILVNLSREEYREFRSLVIDMVLATDMTCHFQQIKSAKSLLSLPELKYSIKSITILPTLISQIYSFISQPIDHSKLILWRSINQ